MQRQTWLELICQMIPGIKQAVFLTDSLDETEKTMQWPASATIYNDLHVSAKLAADRQESITRTLPSSQDDDGNVDMIIALPLAGIDDFTGALAILARIKPSQQSVVMQLLQWTEKWLQLLYAQPHERPACITVEERSWLADKFFMLWSNTSRRILIAVFLMIAVMFIMEGNYRVTSPASIEGRIQRVIVAPFDGFIDNAYARAGESVTSGEVIAEMDSKELLLQQQRYAAEKNEYTRQYRKALASRDKAQAHIYKSQVSQAEAQLQLLEKKIQRSKLIAPLDGYIIRGDLSRSLGSPVDTGDVLFEIAPLDEYRLVIYVDEKQVVDVQQGLYGELSLKALPDTGLSFVVSKVSPVFEENNSDIAYRVEATLEDSHPALRPGMQGIAKIDIGQRSISWIYLHELYDIIRLWFWSWLP